jgi:hypothetical protein
MFSKVRDTRTAVDRKLYLPNRPSPLWEPKTLFPKALDLSLSEKCHRKKHFKRRRSTHLTHSHDPHCNDGFRVLPKRVGRQELEVVPISIFPRQQAGERIPGAVVSGPEVGEPVDGRLVGFLQCDALDRRGGASEDLRFQVLGFPAGGIGGGGLEKRRQKSASFGSFLAISKRKG